MTEKKFSKEDYQEQLKDADWNEYKKKVTTKAVRIEGEFIVATSEGDLRCKDGFLAVDSRGYPYPIATEEFNQIYELVEEQPKEEQKAEEQIEEKDPEQEPPPETNC